MPADPKTRNLHARFLEFARPYKREFAAGFVLLAATNALALGIPWLLGRSIRAMEAHRAMSVLARFALGIVALALVQAFVRTRSRLAILGASRKISFDIRNRFYAQLTRLDAAFYDRWRTGEIMSRGINDLQLLQSFYGPGVLNLLNTAIVYVAVIVALFRIDLVLTIVALSLFPVLWLAVNRLSRRVYGHSLAVQEQLALLSNRAQENLSGIGQVRIYAQEAREIASFGVLCAEYRTRSLALARTRGLLIALIGLASGAGTIVVLGVGGTRVLSGRLAFADFVAYNAYLAQLAWPTVALGWTVNVFQRGAGAMTRIDEVLRLAPAIPSPMDDPPTPPAPLEGDIEIRHLSYAYPGMDGDPERVVLRDINLTIPQGSRVALVGPVGAGKSTLASLLARIHPAPRGTIFIGGVDIVDLPVAQVRHSTGFVPQEGFLFSRSLRDNIALGKPDATDAQIDDAVQTARLTQELAALPDGIDTIVGERGQTLSGGQRQRATLARAIVPDPRLLILDDSLSSVDADTEKAILDGLRRHLVGRTSILITHRPSVLAEVDRILVLDDGRLVEDGTHDELLARQGVYHRLFRRQLLEAGLEDEMEAR